MKKKQWLIIDNIVSIIAFIYIIILPWFWERSRIEFLVFSIFLGLEKIVFITSMKDDISQRKKVFLIACLVLFVGIAIIQFVYLL